MKLPQIGEVFEGYLVDAPLGAGGFGSVYRATRLHDGAAVALKILKVDGGAYTANTRARFTREVSLVTQLRSPHIVELLDQGRSADGLLYFVFELVEGRDLAEILAGVDHLNEEIVEHVLVQLLHGLHEAHRFGVLHRDIKPDNVRIFEERGDRWRAKLLDFGIARQASPVPEAKITKTGALVGTLRYMSQNSSTARPLARRPTSTASVWSHTRCSWAARRCMGRTSATRSIASPRRVPCRSQAHALRNCVVSCTGCWLARQPTGFRAPNRCS